MFYSEEIVSNDYLRTAWQAANDITTDTKWEYSLPEICRNLDTWISSEAIEIRHRLSLRTSAALISGAANLYKTDVDKLLEDAKSLDSEIAGRKRKYFNISSSSADSSEPVATPEQTRRLTSHNFRPSIPSVIRTSTLSAASIKDAPNREDTLFAQEFASVNGESENSGADRCSSSPGGMSARQSEVDSAGTFIAFPTINRTKVDDDHLTEDGLDKNLPFAYIMVFNNHRSRIPSKLIMSSINSDIKKRIIFVDNLQP